MVVQPNGIGLPEGIGVVDLGSLNWSAWAGDTTGYSFVTNIVGITQDCNRVVCDRYGAKNVESAQWAEILTRDKKMFKPLNGTYLLIRDTDYSDATAFKSAMSGVLLFYKKA